MGMNTFFHRDKRYFYTFYVSIAKYCKLQNAHGATQNQCTYLLYGA